MLLRPWFCLRTGHLQQSANFLVAILQWTCTMTFHPMCSRKYHTSYKIFITPYIHIWIQYKPIIGRIRGCCVISIKKTYISVYGRQCVYGTFPSSNIAHSRDGRIALKYDIHEFDGLRIDIIDALHFDHRYGYSVLIDYSTGNATEPCANFIFFLFQIYLYRVNHSVTLFFHGALLQSKIHKHKEHIYTHS